MDLDDYRCTKCGGKSETCFCEPDNVTPEIEESQTTAVQQLKAEIRSLLANYESDVVLRGAPKSEGWFFNRLRELSLCTGQHNLSCPVCKEALAYKVLCTNPECTNYAVYWSA